MRSKPDLLRLARRIQAFYERRLDCRHPDQHSALQRLDMGYEEVRRLRRLIETSELRGWHHATRQQREHLSSALGECVKRASETREQLRAQPTPRPRLQDLLDELRQLAAEFEEAIFDVRKNSIACSTESIVLGGINLGRFLIRLHCPRLAERADIECFEVVALDPHSASSDSDVTHPHVKDYRLCTGDATIPLQKALEQGRIADAFCLMRSVLETYNSGSAYISLDDWDGISCWNCGYSADSDDLCFCERCEHDVCYECTSSCKQCDHSRCASCQTRCDECNAPCCPSCLQPSQCSGRSCCAECLETCSECGTEVSSSELDSTTNCCTTCLEQESDEAGIIESMPVPT